MIRTFATNENNDLYINAEGNLAIADKLDAVKQACQTAVKAQFHEMIYEYDKGMPDFSLVWVGNPNYGQYRAALAVTLSNVDGVDSVTSIEIGKTDNVLRYRATIITEFGSAALNG